METNTKKALIGLGLGGAAVVAALALSKSSINDNSNASELAGTSGGLVGYDTGAVMEGSGGAVDYGGIISEVIKNTPTPEAADDTQFWQFVQQEVPKDTIVSPAETPAATPKSTVTVSDNGVVSTSKGSFTIGGAGSGTVPYTANVAAVAEAIGSGAIEYTIGNYNPSDEKADVSGVNNLTDLNDYYLNNFGITQAQYKSLKTEWESSPARSKYSFDDWLTNNKITQETYGVKDGDTAAKNMVGNSGISQAYYDAYKESTQYKTSSGSPSGSNYKQAVESSKENNKYVYTGGNSGSPKTETKTSGVSTVTTKTTSTPTTVTGAVISGVTSVLSGIGNAISGLFGWRK